jgi:polyisoprenoid-binding protein YceI
MKTRWLAIVGAGFGVIFSGAVAALDIEATRSSISYLSTKNNAVAEEGEFTRFSGSLSEAGELVLDIDLSSIDSRIEQRDGRMREFLFDVARFPAAKVRAKVAMDGVPDLQIGQELLLDVGGRLSLHGIAHSLTLSVRVTRLADGALRATTVHPVMLRVSDFALETGVEKLRSLAALDSIAGVVPVYFSLVFTD